MILIVFFAVATIATLLVAVISRQWDSTVATALLALAMLRVYSLYRAVAWIWKRGHAYDRLWNQELGEADRKSISEETPAGQELLYDLYRTSGALFFPFGVRGLVLWRWRARANNRLASAARSAVYRLWKFYFFTVAWAVAVEVLAYGAGPEISPIARVAGLAGVVLVMLGCLSIGIEASLCYLIFRGWSLSYHQLNVASKSSITEFAALAGGAASLLLSLHAAIAFCARTSESFDAIPSHAPILRQIGLSAYYTVTILTGNGDPGPHGFASHAVVSLAYVLALVFVVVVISLLFDAIGRTSKA